MVYLLQTCICGWSAKSNIREAEGRYKFHKRHCKVTKEQKANGTQEQPVYDTIICDSVDNGLKCSKRGNVIKSTEKRNHKYDQMVDGEMTESVVNMKANGRGEHILTSINI